MHSKDFFFSAALGINICILVHLDKAVGEAERMLTDGGASDPSISADLTALDAFLYAEMLKRTDSTLLC